MSGKVVRLSDNTWRRLQRFGHGFRADELGTPDKVVARLLDEHEARNPRAEEIDGEGLRDATAVELLDEPDGILEDMANGNLEVTATTRQLAQSELIARRERAQRGNR